MKPKVFISRDLTSDSILVRSEHWDCTGFSLIEFHPVDVFTIPRADWVFFYSQNAVKFFFQQIPGNTKQRWLVGAFGPGTATIAESFVTVHFVGNGRAEPTASAFQLVANNSSVLFPRAVHSRRSIQNHLSPAIEVIDLPVYHNEIQSDWENPNADYLVFTSPLNVRSYCSRLSIRPSQTVIAIGATTQAELMIFGIDNVHLPARPSENAIHNLLLNLIS